MCIRAVILLSLLAPVASILAEENPWTATASLLMIAEDNGNEGAPTPFLPTAGLSRSIFLAPSLYFEPGLDFYSTWYAYPDSLDRAVPIEQENRSARVFGFLATFPLSWHYELPRDVELRVNAGLSLDMRLALTASGLEGADKEDAAEETSSCNAWFWGGGRFLLPTAGVSADKAISGRLILGLSLRFWAPVWKLWDSQDLPGAEGWKMALGLRFRLKDPEQTVASSTP